MPQVWARAVAVGMASLDGLDLHAIFRRRPIVMPTVPTFLKGAFTAALRVTFDECIADWAHRDKTREVRALKLFLLIPRMLLHRPPRGGLVPRKWLEERFRSFEAGEWESLVIQSMPGAEQAAILSARRRRRERTGDVEGRAARAVRFVQMGELSAGRQALEGAESQSETFCGVWWPGLLRSSTAKELRMPRHLFSTHYQRTWDASALRTSSKHSLASMRRPQWCGSLRLDLP